MTPFDAASAPDIHKTTPPDGSVSPPTLQRCERVSEGEFVCALHEWMNGGDWSCEHATYAPYNGYSIRLRQHGDELRQHAKGLPKAGVAVVSRNPVTLIKGPDGTGATMRSEAHALCRVAIRGDVGMYV